MKKRIILLVCGIVGCLGILFSFQLKNKNNLQENNIKNKNGSLAIMIKENGATDYTKSSSNTIPVGDYILNEEKTSCENGGKISDYNSATGKIKISLLGADKCYLYFDYKESKELYKLIAKRYNSNDTYVKLYSESDASTYANPVYYFNGAVEDNNVLFAGFCWKIVRTTETGGVKIVYNVVQKDGSCNNTGTDSQIGESAFNNDYNFPAYVGYMYNTVYPYSSKRMSSQSNIVFGNTFTYSGTHTLSDTKTVATWSSGYNTINNNHYTCMSTGTTCSSIYYVYYTDSTTAYYITLSNGKSVDDALNEMLYADDVNKNDSEIKKYIDKWYEFNIKDKYDNKLEDTVFCNDRSMSNESSNGWNPNGGSTSNYLQFKNTSTSNQSLAYANETDRFNTKAYLKYPIGLLSFSELKLAGYSNANGHYFNNGQNVWLASPIAFLSDDAIVGMADSEGLSDMSVADSGGVRPSVSIKPGTGYTSGDGSYTNPFVVE